MYAATLFLCWVVIEEMFRDILNNQKQKIMHVLNQDTRKKIKKKVMVGHGEYELKAYLCTSDVKFYLRLLKT